jgi:organic radical activating enzyme
MSQFSHAYIFNDLQIGWLDYPDPISHSINVYISGCDNNCSHCSNPDLQFYSFGEKFSSDNLFRLIRNFSKIEQTNRVCLLGGDPLANKNIAFTRELLFLLKENDFHVCLYTGHSYCTVRRIKIAGFKFIKTGRFVKELECKSEKTSDYIQFASTNQRLYNENLELLSHKGRYYFK